jgi:GxxExxY protein
MLNEMNDPERKDAEPQRRENDATPASLRPCVVASSSSPLTEDEISRHIVEAAIEVHRTLGGPGLLESVYVEALVWELEDRGLTVEREVWIQLEYKGRTLASRLRIDLIVNGKVIIECKAATAYNKIFEAQTLTYLRLTGLKLGMVINFGERMVRNGIHRVVNGL